MRKHIARILLIACTFLAGCSSPQAPAATEPGEIKNEAQATGETAQTVQIVLERSGGFAGVDERWLINSDGRITASDGKNSQVSIAELSAAVADLENLGFFELQNSYMPLDTCCDRFTYKLSVTAAGKAHTVTALEGDQETPEELWKAIEIVNGLITGATN
jgi:hypothetical protein